jgi:hypothetical protein
MGLYDHQLPVIADSAVSTSDTGGSSSFEIVSIVEAEVLAQHI